MTLSPGRTIKAVLTGMAQVACGQVRGIGQFSDTTRAILGSFAPGFGFLAGAIFEGLAEGNKAKAFANVPASLCMLLAPSVLSFELARRWGRAGRWYRYIVAFNWCQWLLPIAGLLAINIVALFAGPGTKAGGLAVLGALTAYALWINWFLVRHGLSLTTGRAILFVFAVNFGTAILMFVPILLAGQIP